MKPGKLKAHNDFRQGNIFQGSLKLFAAQYKQKSPSTTFYRYIQKKKHFEIKPRLGHPI
jgi:hypothetical protein